MEQQADPRYPIGKFNLNLNISQQDIERGINEIEAFPGLLKRETIYLNDEQLNTPYREGGWNVRQVVHHTADSHMNAFIRFKWALTEDDPQIKTYDEKRWAELKDVEKTPIEISLDLLASLHFKWVVLLRSLSEEELEKQFVHPEWGKVKLKLAIMQYSWHCRHHLAHITNLSERMGW